MNRCRLNRAFLVLGLIAQFVIHSAAQAAAGAGGAVVEAVQMPAWVERAGAKIPLAPGMELQDRDRVLTGANSRLLLRMPEGSGVKLGENGSLLLDSLRMQPERRVFSGAINVLEGAFRFTTNLLRKSGGVKRDINIIIATVTTGVRGTDIWGKSAADRDIVCLIEGRIEVQRGAEAPIVMDQPLSFYIAPRGRLALPVAPVPKEQLEQWAAETEIQAGKGAARSGGKWKVVLASVETQEAALRVYDDVRAGGYAAEIRPVKLEDRRIYNVRVANLASRAEAQALADALRGKMGVTEPKVSK